MYSFNCTHVFGGKLLGNCVGFGFPVVEGVVCCWCIQYPGKNVYSFCHLSALFGTQVLLHSDRNSSRSHQLLLSWLGDLLSMVRALSYRERTAAAAAAAVLLAELALQGVVQHALQTKNSRIVLEIGHTT